MSFDFRKLKPFTCANGEVTVLIPERWTGRNHETDEGRWGCYEDDDEDTGTLWIAVDHFRWAGEGDPPADFDFKETVDGMVEESTANLPPLLESTLTPVDQGYHWYRVYDEE